jgi:hypothetical protein
MKVKTFWEWLYSETDFFQGKDFIVSPVMGNWVNMHEMAQLGYVLVYGEYLKSMMRGDDIITIRNWCATTVKNLTKEDGSVEKLIYILETFAKAEIRSEDNG